MGRIGTLAIRLAVMMISLTALAACSSSDYSDGIGAFSAAVTKANTAEQALITADQQSDLNNEITKVSRGNLAYTPPDLVKCRSVPGPYKASDCVVKLGGQAVPVTAEASSFGGMTKYAALLSSVVADKTCTTLDTDAKGLATAIGEVATDAGNKTLATPAGALATIVSNVGCIIIENMQLKILRAATKAANPIVMQLVPIIVAKDSMLQANAIGAAVAQLSATARDFDATKSAADLKQIIALSQAIDQAQLAPPGPVIQSLAKLHQTLTDDLDSPTVSLKRVQNDAQAFITAASAVESAANSLANPTSVTPAKAAAKN